MTDERDPRSESELPTNRLVRDLIGKCTGLIDLMGRETELLKAMRPKDIVELQEEKTFLARSYEQQARQLAADPACLKAVEPVLREELETAMRALEQASGANELALRAAREANDRTIRAIVAAVMEQTEETGTYGRDGAQRAGEAAGGGKSLALSLDQQL